MSQYCREFVATVLDYGAGNVRSLSNAIKHLGFETRNAQTADDIENAQVIVFPGQGCFGQAVQSLKDKGLYEPLIKYIKADRPFFGICLGMQLLFESSEESPGVEGLGIIKGKVTRFQSNSGCKIPQIGWNGLNTIKTCSVMDNISSTDKAYFVHSYCALPTEDNLEWVLSVTDYGLQNYISIVQKGNVIAAQFHPEKSGAVGLEMIRAFLATQGRMNSSTTNISSLDMLRKLPQTVLAKRVIACLDVRSNDSGDLIVTKGDQYDVREESAGAAQGRGGVRNLGKPVALCKRYYEEGADEVVFLNITSFRQGVVDDLPMLQVLEASSENVFVPLTVGGGIREYTDTQGNAFSALEVAGRYFRAGADKVSIGSDAVYAAEEYLRTLQLTGMTSIEQISNHYGAQAVVVSIDPKRVYVSSPDVVPTNNTAAALSEKTIVQLSENYKRGPNGEAYCWWQVTVKGGRESRDIDAIQLAKICEILGAGEIMLNCIDMDGQRNGYDIPLIQAVQQAVSIPVIASSGAGQANHFVEVFQQSDVNAALAAGIFHRHEVTIQQVKETLEQANIPIRSIITRK